MTIHSYFCLTVQLAYSGNIELRLLHSTSAVFDKPARMGSYRRAALAYERDNPVIRPALFLIECHCYITAPAIEHLQMWVFPIARLCCRPFVGSISRRGDRRSYKFSSNGGGRFLFSLPL